MLAGIVLGLAWFSLFFISHVCLFHFRTVRRRFRVLSCLFFAALLGLLASCWVVSGVGTGVWGMSGGGVVGVAAGLGVLFSLFVLYMPFYYTLAASLSLQTVIAIQRANGQELSLPQLGAMFVTEDLVRRRLDSMANSGMLVKDGGGFRLTPKGRCVARVFSAFKRLWRLGPGG